MMDTNSSSDSEAVDTDEEVNVWILYNKSINELQSVLTYGFTCMLSNCISAFTCLRASCEQILIFIESTHFNQTRVALCAYFNQFYQNNNRMYKCLPRVLECVMIYIENLTILQFYVLTEILCRPI